MLSLLSWRTKKGIVSFGGGVGAGVAGEGWSYAADESYRPLTFKRTKIADHLG